MAYKSNAALVDEFAALLASKAALAEREKQLKEQLQKRAKRDADGLLFIESGLNRVTISEVEAGEAFDARKAQALLTASQIAKCMKPRAASVRFNCKAKVADIKVAA
jgi:hypothetical protein